jgi:hypothetical protein
MVVVVTSDDGGDGAGSVVVELHKYVVVVAIDGQG